MKRSTRNSAKGQSSGNNSIKLNSPTVANVNKNLSSHQTVKGTTKTPKNDQNSTKEAIPSSSAPKKSKFGPNENLQLQTKNFDGEVKKVAGPSKPSTTAKEKLKPNVTKQNGGSYRPKVQSCSTQEDNQIISMSVDADEDQFDPSEDDEYDDLSQSVHGETSQEYSDSDDDGMSTDSIKIRPMTNEERLRQMDEIDTEMTTKLKQLHDLMAGGVLKQSVRFLEQHFGVEKETAVGTPMEPMQTKRSKKSQEVPPPMEIASGEQHAPIISSNVNYNHKPLSQITEASRSIETIYKNAVAKRISSSSEEGGIDVSDENMEFFPDAEFQPDYDEEVMEQDHAPTCETQRQMVEPVHPSMSQQQPILAVNESIELTPEQKAEKLVIAVENAKARIFPNTGTVQQTPFNFTAKIDEDYLVVGAHIDEQMKNRIIKGEYVDFGKLLPRDRILAEEDGRLELVIRNGKTFWVPVSESVSINGFSRWEQAFRIYSNIYTHQYPHWSTELIQYNHIIHSIAGLYTWENVYSYDKEFRLHLAKHPERSWSVILQQAWAMKLRDRLHRPEFQLNQSHGANNEKRSRNSGGMSTGEPCRHYNRGHCNFGTRCRYNHRCSYEPCGKFGHNILNCRKLQADREKGINKKGSNNNAGASTIAQPKDN